MGMSKLVRQAIAEERADLEAHWSGWISRETQKAILFKRALPHATGATYASRGVWLPKSQITIEPDPFGNTDGSVQVNLPKWLARTKMAKIN